eukprot:m.150440 g.150440  ORF g.150440 m.150440 type:complete len:70 (+) comp30725_c1_seq1:265-474(+)
MSQLNHSLSSDELSFMSHVVVSLRTFPMLFFIPMLSDAVNLREGFIFCMVLAFVSWDMELALELEVILG